MAAAKENIVIDVTVDTKDATKSISGIENRIEELTSQRNELQIGTEEFKKVSREIQGLESQIKNVDLQFEALDFEQKFTAGTDAVVGLAGGFMAAQGAAQMMGIESESLEKGLAKMAAAMSLSMGLRDMANGIIALRKFGVVQKASVIVTNLWTAAQSALNVAMLANPIGVIVALVAALVAAIVGLVYWLSSAEEATNEWNDTAQLGLEQQIALTEKLISTQQRQISMLKDAQKAVSAGFDKENAALQKRLALAEANGKKDEDILAIKKEILDNDKERFKEEAKGMRDELFHLQMIQVQTKKAVKATKDATQREEKRVALLAAVHAVEDKRREIAAKDRDAAAIDTQKEILDIELKSKKQQEADDKEKANADKRATRKEKEAARTSQQLQSEEAALNAFYQAVEQTETAHFNSFLSDQEKEEQAVKDKFFELITLAEKYGEDTALLEEARQKELRKIRQKYGAQERIEAGEKAIEIQKLLEAAKIQNIADENERAKVERQKQFDDETLALMEEGMLTHDLEIELKKKLDADLAELDIAAKAAQKERTLNIINASFDAAQNSVNALSALNEASSLKRISEIDSQTQAQVQGLEEGDSRRKAIEEVAEQRKLEIQKKAFERGKKIQIAQAIISGLQGVVNIWSATSTIPQPYDAILRAVNTAALIATTAAQISKIKSTPFAGGGSVSGGGAGASAGAGGVPINNISNTASLVDQQQQEITAKVVVVESDITTTQENVATVSEVSTF